MLDNKRKTPFIALLGAAALMVSAPAFAQDAAAPAAPAADAAAAAPAADAAAPAADAAAPADAAAAQVQLVLVRAHDGPVRQLLANNMELSSPGGESVIGWCAKRERDERCR